MRLFFDTCVLPRAQLETAGIYRTQYGKGLGIELLPMFDLADFEADLKQNLTLLADGPLLFHEPVWGVEHTAPRGSAAYEEGMYHILLTKKYAELLRPESMVCHLNNCAVQPEHKDTMLKTALTNLAEMQELFPDVRLLIENTGTDAAGNKLLSQEEFTALCREQDFDVLIDVGHANANGWDIKALVLDLKEKIRGFHLHNNDGVHDEHRRLSDGTLDFSDLLPYLIRTVPEADFVIEYTRPEYHGEPLITDLAAVLAVMEGGAWNETGR